MKLSIQEDASLGQVEVLIRCPQVDDRVRRIMAAAQMEDRKFAAFADGFLRVVAPAEVLYVEHVDGRTFLYLRDGVLESNLTLADIERDLEGSEFVRATRQMLVNLAHVVGLRPYLGARLELVLDNDEHVIVSRQFAPQVKKRIGL